VLQVAEFKNAGAEIQFKKVIFGNSSYIFSATVDLITGSEQTEESTFDGDRCVLMFLGGNYSIVLATNPVM